MSTGPPNDEVAEACLQKLEKFHQQIAELCLAGASEAGREKARTALLKDVGPDETFDWVGRELQVLQRFVGHAVGEVVDEESCRIRNYITRAVRLGQMPYLTAAHPERYLAARIHSPSSCVGLDFGALFITDPSSWTKKKYITVGSGDFNSPDGVKEFHNHETIHITASLEEPNLHHVDVIAHHRHPDLLKIERNIVASASLIFGTTASKQDREAWENFRNHCQKGSVFDDKLWQNHKPPSKTVKLQYMVTDSEGVYFTMNYNSQPHRPIWIKPIRAMLSVAKSFDNISIVHPRYYHRLALLVKRIAIESLPGQVEGEAVDDLDDSMQINETDNSQDQADADPEEGEEGKREEETRQQNEQDGGEDADVITMEKWKEDAKILKRIAQNLLDQWYRCYLQQEFVHAVSMKHDINAALATNLEMCDSYGHDFLQLDAMIERLKNATEIIRILAEYSPEEYFLGIDNVIEDCVQEIRKLHALSRRITSKCHEVYVDASKRCERQMPTKPDFISCKFLQIACERQAALDVLVGNNQRKQEVRGEQLGQPKVIEVSCRETVKCALTELDGGSFSLVFDDSRDYTEAAVAVAASRGAFLVVEKTDSRNFKEILLSLRSITQEAFPDFLGVAIAVSLNHYVEVLAWIEKLGPFPVAVAAMHENMVLDTKQKIVFWNTSAKQQGTAAGTPSEIVKVRHSILPNIVY